jgi:hypothetical protein
VQSRFSCVRIALLKDAGETSLHFPYFPYTAFHLDSSDYLLVFKDPYKSHQKSVFSNQGELKENIRRDQSLFTVISH